MKPKSGFKSKYYGSGTMRYKLKETFFLPIISVYHIHKVNIFFCIRVLLLKLLTRYIIWYAWKSLY